MKMVILKWMNNSWLFRMHCNVQSIYLIVHTMEDFVCYAVRYVAQIAFASLTRTQCFIFLTSFATRHTHKHTHHHHYVSIWELSDVVDRANNQKTQQTKKKMEKHTEFRSFGWIFEFCAMERISYLRQTNNYWLHRSSDHRVIFDAFAVNFLHHFFHHNRFCTYIVHWSIVHWNRTCLIHAKTIFFPPTEETETCAIGIQSTMFRFVVVVRFCFVFFLCIVSWSWCVQCITKDKKQQKIYIEIIASFFSVLFTSSFLSQSAQQIELATSTLHWFAQIGDEFTSIDDDGGGMNMCTHSTTKTIWMNRHLWQTWGRVTECCLRSSVWLFSFISLSFVFFFWMTKSAVCVVFEDDFVCMIKKYLIDSLTS